MSRKRIFPAGIILTVITFAIIIVFLLAGLHSASQSSEQQGVLATQRSLQKAIAQCYAIEGCYPPDITYLENNYGLTINHEKYIIHYQIVAANLLPNVLVIAKDQ